MANPIFYMLPLTTIVSYLTNLGVIAAGATITTQVAGSVSTLQTTYTDSTGIVQNPNPLTLNSSGRAAGQSGALVGFWVAAGVVVDVYFVDALGETWIIKGMAGINDPTVLQALLANPVTGSGADLIANAMRSYDVVATVQAANPPSLTGSQTLVIDVEGQSVPNDGNGGLFYWSPASTATDDNGATTIKPSSIAPASPGRYLRQANLFGTSGTFNLGVTGLTTTPTLACRYVKNGPMVTISYPSLTGTSNSTAFGLTGFPNGLQGVSNAAVSSLLPASDNSATGVAAYWTIPNQIGGSSIILTPNNASGLWTNSGTKGLLGGSFSYVAT